MLAKYLDQDSITVNSGEKLSTAKFKVADEEKETHKDKNSKFTFKKSIIDVDREGFSSAKFGKNSSLSPKIKNNQKYRRVQTQYNTQQIEDIQVKELKLLVSKKLSPK